MDDPMPADGVIGVDFSLHGAILFDGEDGDADGEGVVECLRYGRVGAVGREGRAEGEDGGTGGREEGDSIGGFGGGHLEEGD